MQDGRLYIYLFLSIIKMCKYLKASSASTKLLFFGYHMLSGARWESVRNRGECGPAGATSKEGSGFYVTHFSSPSFPCPRKAGTSAIWEK
jgi:hypothetical protein